MKQEKNRVNVNLWGTCIGKLGWNDEKHCSVFQFSNEYGKLPFDICPITHPKGKPLSASIHSMGVMGKRSSLMTSNFLDFAEDFVEKPEEKIRKVFQAVEKFRILCEKYNVDPDIAGKIESVLNGLVIDDIGLL